MYTVLQAVYTVLQAPSKAGLLTIPGFTHPVKDLYLEDALQMTGYKVGAGSRLPLPPLPNTPLRSSLVVSQRFIAWQLDIPTTNEWSTL